MVLQRQTQQSDFHFTLQYCDGFCCKSTWIGYRYTCVPSIPNPPPTSLPTPSLWVAHHSLGALLPVLNLHWSSILHTVIYMFQCCSLKLSHHHLLPLSPKVCSLHLCLLCCCAYRIVGAVFLNSVYMHWYTVFVFLFLTSFTLCNRIQVHPSR